MIKSFLEANEQPDSSPIAPEAKSATPPVISLFDNDLALGNEAGEAEPFILSTAEPESMLETARKSGLAWSMGVVFFSAVVAMLILGWGADLLFGSSPWGIVIGIVIGSLIGFFQLFRISSQIFKRN